MKRRTIALLGLTLVTAALPALASDGRIEINQAKALAGSVTPGDGPGFPVQINAPGSYVLTSDLDLSVAPSPQNTHGIMVQTGGVTLDFNGFALRGVTVCTGQGSTLSCAPLANPGSGYGVYLVGSDIAVRNGTVRGTGGPGIYQGAGSATVIEDLVVASCGGPGVFVAGDVRRVRAERNYDVGIRTEMGTVEGCTVLFNRYEGIRADTAAVVTGNVARGNGAAGIAATSSVVVDNLAQFNEGWQFGLNFCGWRGNAALDCGALPCQAGPSLQTGINNCDGAPCP
ncbi:MAG: right-handed parallel beta-helix repeat-containing protein [Thermoanaerobaculia bacterium]|nr:MAG: right-handed parallel beta-helix repeat-containing protein [Thermoanaerobaculia bacterium]